jgi:hypothetical protein
METCVTVGASQSMSLLRAPEGGSLFVVIMTSASFGVALSQLIPVQRLLARLW